MVDYTITPVIYGNNEITNITGLNNAGDVIGTYFSGQNVVGFAKVNGVYSSINGPSGATDVTPIAINNVGIVVGNYNDASDNQHGFAFNAITGQYINIEPAGSYASTATGINASGQIVGNFDDNNGEHGFIYNTASNTTTIFNYPNADNLDPNGINDAGQVVGRITDATATNREFIYDSTSGTFTVLNAPNGTSDRGANFNSGVAINNSGQIVGDYGNNPESGFTYQNGTYTVIQDSGFDNTQLTSINDSGEIIGSATDDDGGSASFSYQNGSYQDLTSLNGGNARIGALNRSGQIGGVSEDGAFIATPVCFCTGTLILTARGEVAVEDLKIGDLAVSASGEQRPVKWIGHREVDCAAHPRPAEVMPVRVAAGALGPNRPARDLWVSPGHALCLDVLGEVLVPASSLVNGATVAQVEVERVTYWHVEVDSHDILLADGQPAESYMDCGNRAFFGTGEGAVDPDRAAATPADYCRPFHHDDALVAAVRGQLAARARALGWTVGGDPLADLHLLVDGARLDAEVDGLSARFVVPAAAAEVWLASEAAVPRDIDSDPHGDCRRLGTSVRALTVDDGLSVRREIALDDARLAAGWHNAEPDHRWTDGRARLPAELWERCRGLFFLRVDLGGPAVARWVAPEGTALSEAPVPEELQRGLRLVHTAA